VNRREEPSADGTGQSAAYRGGVPVAEVVRSGFVEGRHHGSVAVLGADGSVLASAGDPYGPMFPRSSNKPMQAVAMLRSGLALAPEELAVACGSHNGEPMHVDRVRAILRGGGLTEDDLRCPPDRPLLESAWEELVRGGGSRGRVYMNCSGKHAAMLRTCQVAGWPLDDYRAASHPLQVEVGEVLAELAGEPVTVVGVDGCGAPVFALSLVGLARAFLAVVSAGDGPQRAVADAMRAHPELMSGTDREDARLMRGVPGLLGKVGAEGVYAAAVPGVGAVAVKIDDGAIRARDAVAVCALRRLGIDGVVLDELAEPVLRGGGLPVGSVRATKLF
jgi:L-asparaginase II